MTSPDTLMPPHDAAGAGSPWLIDLEQEHQPISDFDLSRVWRRMNREQAALDELETYLAQVTSHVRASIALRKEKIAELRQLALNYLQGAGRQKVQLPDLGTVYVTARQQVRIDEAAAFAWAEREGASFLVAKPALDKDALKKHVLATGEVVPGVSVEEVTTVAFRGR